MQDKQNGNPEKKLFLSRSIFVPVFRDLSESEYCEYSRASRNTVSFTTGTTNFIKACGSPADRCRVFFKRQ
nr:MAG TPA: hypothetical protein [Caudoviricetes sp.]